jgi:phosphotriesterase-related protein
MNRRAFLSFLGSSLYATAARGQAATSSVDQPPKFTIRTVRGPIAAHALGRTLPHEHVLVDFIGADRVSPSRYDPLAVFNKTLPHVRKAVELGFQAIFEATPNFLGRDPRLLARLSEASGIHFVTNTGLYGARQNKFVPPYAHHESAEQLSQRWIAEAEQGIGETGIRPGFIKSGVDTDPTLSPLHEKLVRAAALTHAATGLTMAVHTGRGPGLQQLALLREHRVAPAAFIWVHAQGARDDDLFAAAELGAWLSFDGLNQPTLPRHLHLCIAMKQRGHLGQILLSHDAGWYDPEKPEGGPFRNYELISTAFLPLLSNNGFTAAEIDQLTIQNPANAFGVRPRALS